MCVCVHSFGNTFEDVKSLYSFETQIQEVCFSG